MSKNWKIIIPTAELYNIPWESKNHAKLEEFSCQTSQLELPEKTNTHLWLINLSTFDHKPYSNCLSNDEKDKLDRIIITEERERRGKSRILLRIILAEYLHISPSEIVFTYNENGKPAIETPLNKLSFNLSHSSNNLAILIDSYRFVGIDIETELRSSKIGIELAKRFFYSTEISLLQQAKDEEQSTLFNLLWTLKEAALKSTGLGVFLIDKAPDFSFVIQKKTDLNLQFYKTKNHAGFIVQTKEFLLSTAAEN